MTTSIGSCCGMLGWCTCLFGLCVCAACRMAFVGLHDAHAVLLVVVCYLLRSCPHNMWCARARAVVYGIVSCGGVMDVAAGGAGGGIIGVDGGRRGRTVVVVVRVIDEPRHSL